jgi:predicted aspartyl protease
MPNIEFRRSFQYSANSDGILIPVTLSCGQIAVELLGCVDTGSANCMFEREHGEALGLDIESGYPQKFRTATGILSAFGHVVVIEALGIRFESMAYFLEDSGISKNLLGRTGWLDRIRLGFIDHDQMLLIAEYDFEPAN